MAPPKDPPNIADIAASHIEHLNRIPGIQVPENGWSLSVPGRQLLSSTVIFDEGISLSDRQRANGTVLIQCVDFFAEFLPGDSANAPASSSDVVYGNSFWTLIKNMLPYNDPRLTCNGLKHVYDLLMEARSRYQLAHRLRDLPVNITKEEKYFLTCLDKHEAHSFHVFSDAQLKYGQRRDDDFAARMATRVSQWRHLTRNTRNFRILLYMMPVLTMDIMPVEEWDAKFLANVGEHAFDFKKPYPPIPKVDDSSKSDDSRELSIIGHMRLQLTTLTGTINEMDEKVTDINKNVADIQQNVVGVEEAVKELAESSNDISRAVNTLRARLVDGYKKVVGKDSDKKVVDKDSDKKGNGYMSNKRPRTAG